MLSKFGRAVRCGFAIVVLMAVFVVAVPVVMVAAGIADSLRFPLSPKGGGPL